MWCVDVESSHSVTDLKTLLNSIYVHDPDIQPQKQDNCNSEDFTHQKIKTTFPFVIYFMVVSSKLMGTCHCLSDGVCVRVYSRGFKIRDRLSDALPPERGAGAQPSGGSQHQSGILVYRRGFHSVSGQYQSSRSSQKFLFWQENHNNSCGIVKLTEAHGWSTSLAGSHHDAFFKVVQTTSWLCFLFVSCMFHFHQIIVSIVKMRLNLIYLWVCVGFLRVKCEKNV